MKRILFAFLLSVIGSGFAAAQILPTPLSHSARPGTFVLSKSTRIGYDQAGRKAAAYLSEVLQKATGYVLKPRQQSGEKQAGNSILFTSRQADASLGPEGYVLQVSPQGITIRATGEAGMFYAVQSLLQLFPAQVYAAAPQAGLRWEVPCGEVRDKPRYGWRSFMLDSGRQYQSPAFIKRYLDYLAMLKINVFHWHLSEGQGWRLEIKKYPRLTSVGSQVAKGKEQQGFYTQEQVRDIVAYAQARHIMVVPEIDVPGHSEAALTAYPEFTCLKKAPESVMTFSPHLFCGGNEQTYAFLQDVLDEVAALFPGPYLHLGGDEAPKQDWDACPQCQAKIKEQGLKDSHDLQLYFSKRLASYLKTKNKKVIFWGDVVYADGTSLPDNVVIHWWNWRGHQDLAYKNAVKRGHPVIAGTNYYSYLNFPVTPWSEYNEKRTFDLRMAYEQNPSDLARPDPLVLGMSTCLWTDWNVQQHMVDQRVFPRIYALAEQMWHVGPRLPYAGFYEQVQAKFPALKILNINYGPATREEVPAGYSWE